MGRLQDVDETMTELPERDNEESERIRVFILAQWVKAISSSDTNYQGRLEIKTLICATHGRRQTRWFIFLLRIFTALETAIQVKNFFLYKNPNTLFEQINNFFSPVFWLFLAT